MLFITFKFYKKLNLYIYIFIYQHNYYNLI